MVDAFCQIYKQEGFLSLYSGYTFNFFFFFLFYSFPRRVLKQQFNKSLWCCRITPALIRQSTYGSIKFGTYYSLKQAANEYFQVNEDVAVNLGSAVCSGVISASFANPTDVLKVRLQALGRDKVGNLSKNNVFKCFRHIYVHEGLRGLWKVRFLQYSIL